MTTVPQTENAGLLRPQTGCVARRLVMRVGDQECLVRVTPLVRIEDVLDCGADLQLAAEQEACVAIGEAALVAELLEARMIAPPRPRRRRDRAVSSRAVFYAAAEG